MFGLVLKNVHSAFYFGEKKKKKKAAVGMPAWPLWPSSMQHGSPFVVDGPLVSDCADVWVHGRRINLHQMMRSPKWTRPMCQGERMLPLRLVCSNTTSPGLNVLLPYTGPYTGPLTLFDLSLKRVNWCADWRSLRRACCHSCNFLSGSSYPALLLLSL